MASIERVTENLEAPELDNRSYRVIRLPNKLEALLVHDPDTDKASASVNVNVGSFSDPDDMPGTAHAVEHFLFMGTEKVGPRSCLGKSKANICSTPKKMLTVNTLQLIQATLMHIQPLRRRTTFLKWELLTVLKQVTTV